ncbi:MAG: LacI family DNA-binding transcriptional regulator [Christensenellales bacterium]|jgi:LacI family transcriptional regulator
MDSESQKAEGIREIAKQAGVSIATVSRVINSPLLTSPQTRAKVLEVIEKNQYVPNQIARHFISGKTNSIGFMVFDLRIPFYISIIHYLNQLAFDRGYNVLICDTGTSLEKESKYFKYCQSIRASGVVFTEGWTRGWEHKLGVHYTTVPYPNMPIVLLDRNIVNNHNCYIVKSNHYFGITLLMNHLYALGHKDIGFIRGPVFMSSANERYDSYLANLKKYNLHRQSHLIFNGDFTEKSGMDAFDYFQSLPYPPTAIIASDDAMAKGFILKAFACGVEIPEKYSVCGVDGVEEKSFFPPLTTIKQDTKALAEAIFNFIINAKSIKPPNQAIIDVSLIKGRTCRRIKHPIIS